jgi:hypothetical protein
VRLEDHYREEDGGVEEPMARILVLGRDNWPIWKEKFKALLVYKSLYVAIESPDSVEGRKASNQARSLMIMHTEDAYMKLFAGADTADKACRKLHENFEKTSNARVVQLRKKLTSLTLMPGKSIAEYVGEFQEIKMDLETAGQTVFELELAVHALNGLPKEYATPVEYLELSETELTLDMLQPKLMQREQKLKSSGVEVEAPKEEEEESFGKAFAKRERYGVTVTKGLSECRNTGGMKGEASDMRTCYAFGEKGHVRAHCGKRSAECYNYGERGPFQLGV